MRGIPFKRLFLAFCTVLILTIWASGQSQTSDCSNNHRYKNAQNNVVLFITDGLRYDSVNEKDAPTIFKLRQQGVDFRDSHALFPTVTTANASAFATGHLLGDTGNFANGLYTEFAITNADGRIGVPGGSATFHLSLTVR